MIVSVLSGFVGLVTGLIRHDFPGLYKYEARECILHFEIWFSFIVTQWDIETSKSSKAETRKPSGHIDHTTNVYCMSMSAFCFVFNANA